MVSNPQGWIVVGWQLLRYGNRPREATVRVASILGFDSSVYSPPRVRDNKKKVSVGVRSNGRYPLALDVCEGT